MLPERDLAHLADVLRYAERAISYAGAISYDDFSQSPASQDAIIRCLTVIGEASGRLSDAARATFPDFDWQAMKGMRNILVHEYGRVHLPTVWSVVGELRTLVNTLTTYLEAQP